MNFVFGTKEFLFDWIIEQANEERDEIAKRKEKERERISLSEKKTKVEWDKFSQWLSQFWIFIDAIAFLSIASALNAIRVCSFACIYVWIAPSSSSFVLLLVEIGYIWCVFFFYCAQQLTASCAQLRTLICWRRDHIWIIHEAHTERRTGKNKAEHKTKLKMKQTKVLLKSYAWAQRHHQWNQHQTSTNEEIQWQADETTKKKQKQREQKDETKRKVKLWNYMWSIHSTQSAEKQRSKEEEAERRRKQRENNRNRTEYVY